MEIPSAQEITLRAQLDAFPKGEAVDLKVFRELMRRAPPGAWVAVARSMPIAPGESPGFTPSRVPADTNLKFGLFLVDPSAPRVEVLSKARGGAREWTNLDTLVQFVEGLLKSTALNNRLRVHVI